MVTLYRKINKHEITTLPFCYTFLFRLNKNPTQCVLFTIYWLNKLSGDSTPPPYTSTILLVLNTLQYVITKKMNNL